MALSDDAVRGIANVEYKDILCSVSVCMTEPSLPEPWQVAAAEYSAASLRYEVGYLTSYPEMVRTYVETNMLRTRMREDQAAFLLFGIHR